MDQEHLEVAVLESSFPWYAFVGEEQGENLPPDMVRKSAPGAPPYWVVDPLDGTLSSARPAAACSRADDIVSCCTGLSFSSRHWLETMRTAESEIIAATENLLAAIFRGDWSRYVELCAEDITAIEPEARGHLIQGLGFHRTYFPESPRPAAAPGEGPSVTISSPHVRVMGDAAVIAYVRLVQSRDALGAYVTSASEETRVWQRIDGKWKHVHFHRSPL